MAIRQNQSNLDVSLLPMEYMYRVANGVIKLKGIPIGAPSVLMFLDFLYLFFSNWSKGWF